MTSHVALSWRMFHVSSALIGLNPLCVYFRTWMLVVHTTVDFLSSGYVDLEFKGAL